MTLPISSSGMAPSAVLVSFPVGGGASAAAMEALVAAWAAAIASSPKIHGSS